MIGCRVAAEKIYHRSAERVSRNLPRLLSRPVADVVAAAASLQEMQHVVANEHGHGSWVARAEALDAEQRN